MTLHRGFSGLAAAVILGGALLALSAGTDPRTSTGHAPPAGTSPLAVEPTLPATPSDAVLSEQEPDLLANTHPAQQPPPGGPQIEFAKTEHDFGEIWDGASRTCQFEFSNTGNEPLVISKVNATCGCTATSLADTEFEPGEGSRLEVTFRPTGKGQQSKRIDVVSNSRERKVTRLTVMADIAPFVTLEPMYLKFEAVELGQAHKATFTVSGRDPNLVIDSVKASGRHVSATLLPADSTTDSTASDSPPVAGVVEVTLRDDAPWGALYGAVEVTCRGRLSETGEEITHTAKAYVSASVYGEVLSDEPMFRIGVVPPGGSFQKKIRLTPRAGEPFTILSAEVRNAAMPGVGVTVTPMEEDDTHGVALLLKGEVGDYLGPINGVVAITTDIPGQEPFGIRFAGVVRADDH